MTLIKFDPVRHFEAMARKMNQFSNEMEKGIVFEKGGFNPRVDIIELDDKILFLAEIPGMGKEDIKISVTEDKILSLTGEKSKEELKETQSVIRAERNYGEFKRSFMLPELADIENIKADFKHGLLEITIGKKDPVEPKEIKIDID